MLKRFRFIKRENEATRLRRISKNIDITERIDFIARSEFNRMIYLAEQTALRGETSLSFDLDIDEKDDIYLNLIIQRFTELLYKEGFTYMRNMIKSRHAFSIYFSQPITHKKLF